MSQEQANHPGLSLIARVATQQLADMSTPPPPNGTTTTNNADALVPPVLAPPVVTEVQSPAVILGQTMQPTSADKDASRRGRGRPRKETQWAPEVIEMDVKQFRAWRRENYDKYTGQEMKLLSKERRRWLNSLYQRQQRKTKLAKLAKEGAEAKAAGNTLVLTSGNLQGPHMPMSVPSGVRVLSSTATGLMPTDLSTLPHTVAAPTTVSLATPAPIPPVAPATITNSAIVSSSNANIPSTIPSSQVLASTSQPPQVRAFPTTTASTFVNPSSSEPHVVAAIPLSQLPMFQSVMQQAGMTQDNIAPQMVQVSIASVPTS
eukprot:m.18615 g.18615  ORF g.18615 m.18615 type:complete len:318 (+) comp10836_c0_seq1:67-1020(+)